MLSEDDEDELELYETIDPEEELDESEDSDEV